MTAVKKLFLEELPGVFEIGRVTGAHALEELDKRGFRDCLVMRQVPGGFLADGGGNKLTVRIVIDITEQRNQFLIGAGFNR